MLYKKGCAMLLFFTLMKTHTLIFSSAPEVMRMGYQPDKIVIGQWRYRPLRAKRTQVARHLAWAVA